MWVSLFRASIVCLFFEKISSFSVSRNRTIFLHWNITKQTKRAKREVDKNCVFFPYNIFSVSYMKNVYDRFAVKAEMAFVQDICAWQYFRDCLSLSCDSAVLAGSVLVQRLESWAEWAVSLKCTTATCAHFEILGWFAGNFIAIVQLVAKSRRNLKEPRLSLACEFTDSLRIFIHVVFKCFLIFYI